METYNFLPGNEGRKQFKVHVIICKGYFCIFILKLWIRISQLCSSRVNRYFSFKNHAMGPNQTYKLLHSKGTP